MKTKSDRIIIMRKLFCEQITIAISTHEMMLKDDIYHFMLSETVCEMCTNDGRLIIRVPLPAKDYDADTL